MPNKRIGKENRKKTSVSLDPKVLEKLGELADKLDRSVSYLLNESAKRLLAEHGMSPQSDD